MESVVWRVEIVDNVCCVSTVRSENEMESEMVGKVCGVNRVRMESGEWNGE